jgi:glycosyltransferase involved in cell wall biosynthesis
VLVIDNCSGDDTRRVAEEFQGRFTHFRYVFEPELGLSNAKNRATRECTGHYIAFLDDDAVAGRHWLSSMLEAFSSGDAQLACVGGPIRPIWERPRPPWLSDALLPYFSVGCDYGAGRYLDGTREYLWGGNMALRVSELKRHGGFRRELGRSGSTLISGEEILLQQRFQAYGLKLYFHPLVEIEHHVLEDRLATPRWVERRAYAQGVSDAVMASLAGAEQSRAPLIALTTTLVRLAGSPKQLLSLSRPLGAQKMVETRCEALRRIGRIREYARQIVSVRREARPGT